MKEKIYINKIQEVMNSAMENLRPLIDVNIVIGKTIEADGLKVVPLSKVTMGFVSGGGEYYSELKEMRRETEYPFSGGIVSMSFSIALFESILTTSTSPFLIIKNPTG